MITRKKSICSGKTIKLLDLIDHFSVETPTRTYYLQADTPADREAWVNAIKEAIRQKSVICVAMQRTYILQIESSCWISRFRGDGSCWKGQLWQSI